MNPAIQENERHNGGRPGSPHLADYWHVVWNRAWLILLIAGVALGAATWAASRRPQLYRASLTLQVGDPRGRMGQIGDIDVSPNLLWTDPIESELQHLTTQSVAMYVVDSLQLRAESPDLPRSHLLSDIRVADSAPNGIYEIRVTREGTVSIRNDPAGSLAEGRPGIPLSFAGVHLIVRNDLEPGIYRFRVVDEEAAMARVRGGLAASNRPETNLIDVTYTDIDPMLAPRILNAVASAARNLGVRRIREWAEARTRFIEDQLAQAGVELQSALEAVESYKEQRSLTSLTSEESRLLRRLSELQSRMEQLVIERNIYVDVIEEVSGSENVRPEDLQQLATLSDASANRAVLFYFDRLLGLLEDRAAGLRQHGKDPSHPEIRALDARIVDTQDRLVTAAEQAAAALGTRIGAIRGSLAGLQDELARLPAVETELARLQNQVEIHTDMYKYLLSRYQESQIAEAEIAPYVDLLDPASWARPVDGGGRMNIILGALIGLLLGLGAAFLLEYLDRSIQSTEDVESDLGLSVLGWIPRTDLRDSEILPLAAVRDPDGPAAEAYRVLRTNLAFSTARRDRLVTLVITSPGPSEGKSTTAANLAAVLASRGDRTLLIDADLRRGQLDRVFDTMRSPGLSDLLTSGTDVREAIQSDLGPGLDLLPAGHRPPNPSELLGSSAMAELLDGLHQSYRWILIDTPPVLAVSDPAVLAARADGVLLVVKSGETDGRAAWRAAEQLEKVKARIIGAVLNDIRPNRSRDGYYLDDYYSRYSRSDRVEKAAVTP